MNNFKLHLLDSNPEEYQGLIPPTDNKQLKSLFPPATFPSIRESRVKKETRKT